VIPMLDMSSSSIHGIRRENPDLTIMQLRTPLTQYAVDPLNVIHYGLDNGAFTEFNEPAFVRMALKAKHDPLCDWIVMPDYLGDSGSTTVLFHYWINELELEDKRAYVAQDGASVDCVPWDLIECVFIGGTNHFKESPAAMAICRKAKELDKWIHVGRVNTPMKIFYWAIIADSFDGSGIARFDHMREAALRSVRLAMQTTQRGLEDWT